MSTVRLNVLRTHRETVPEPDWCAGHASDRAEFRTDITHFGPEHRLTFEGAELFKLMLAQSPFSAASSRNVGAYVEETGYTGTLDMIGLYSLAAALEGAADQIRAFADQHAHLLTGGGQ